MTVIRADSKIAFYIKPLASKKLSDGAEKLKGRTVPSLTKIDSQTVMSKLASEVLNHSLQMFKDALPTESDEEMSTEKVELGIIRSDNPLKNINNRNGFNTYSFFLIRIPMLFTSVCVQVHFGESQVKELDTTTILWLCIVEVGKKTHIGLQGMLI